MGAPAKVGPHLLVNPPWRIHVLLAPKPLDTESINISRVMLHATCTLDTCCGQYTPPADEHQGIISVSSKRNEHMYDTFVYLSRSHTRS